MNIAEYHSGEGVSRSDLRLILRSPAHYKAAKEAPQEETKAMLIGSAFHCLTLEPELFPRRYVVAPDGLDRRTKEGKEAWASFESEAAGKKVLKQEDYEAAEKMAQAIQEHPLGGRLVNGGEAEKSVFWETSTGNGQVLCKCRPDYIKALRGSTVIVDLKSTEDARPEAFGKSSWNYGYHMQAAFYMDGLSATLGPVGAFLFIVVEKHPPYAVAVYQASDQMIDAGRKQYMNALEVYAECTAKDVWPAYPQEIQELWLPGWAV